MDGFHSRLDFERNSISPMIHFILERVQTSGNGLARIRGLLMRNIPFLMKIHTIYNIHNSSVYLIIDTHSVILLERQRGRK